MFFLFFFFYFCLREYLDLVAEQKVLQFDADASVSPSIFFFFFMQMSFPYDAMLFVRLTRAAMTAESFLGFLFSRPRNRHNRMKYNHVIFG